ncbi:hypothetical protein [Dyella japonica]|uniref:Uncharacterized protein n=2 Tax=Dyella japonica TaxID=231455 RepID=A0A075JWX6_9GAMM|nr:hypothetical protein [Dyella japonica]AIF45987.1 hypothetical protein HY57_01250 [Dyella japonica A8]
MTERAISAVLNLIVPACGGILIALCIRNRRAPFVAAAMAWFAYLAFNLYTDGHSRESELLRGTWPFFQLTAGTFVALLAAACAAGTLKVLGNARNYSSKRKNGPPAA